MSTTLANTFVATGAAQATVLVRTGGALINSIQLNLASVTGATVVTFTVYDNSAATNVATAGGATWAGTISPGYSGRGPNTAKVYSNDLQSARFGDQQSQTAPNGSGVRQYWDVNTTTGDNTFTNPPGAKITASITAEGDGSFTGLNSSDPTGTVVAANTSARVLYTTTLTAGTERVYVPIDPIQAVYGINIVIAAAGMTAASASYSINANLLP